jgi:magnesium chelatase subunit H
MNKPLSPEQQAELERLIATGKQMLDGLSQNEQELTSLLNGLNGGYIRPGYGGDVIRDGLSVLPTGRNIHSMDPWRVPSDISFERGTKIANSLIATHFAETGSYPETIVQVLWGLDTIKTKGEPIAIVLGLIGAKPTKDGQGKVCGFELIPLADLKRPRTDVLMNVSAIFRDSFQMQIDFLDKLIVAAATADEPEDMNFIKKHVTAIMQEKNLPLEAATARIFTQQQGNYSSDVDNMVESSSWENEDELGDMFVKRNAFAYGGKKNGTNHSKVLESMLSSVSRISQEIDSVEFGLTDHQHYYSYTGAIQQAAKKRGSGDVKVNYVESFTSETKIQNLDTVIRMEARTKLLNPKWYEGMLKHNHSGASEISNRFTYLLGWSATTKAVDNWVYDEATKTFVMDEAMRQRLEKMNPAALKNIASRLLEASGRGLWHADEAMLEKLRELYEDLEDKLEGVK